MLMLKPSTRLKHTSQKPAFLKITHVKHTPKKKRKKEEKNLHINSFYLNPSLKKKEKKEKKSKETNVMVTAWSHLNGYFPACVC